jgi:hypothetical protein
MNVNRDTKQAMKIINHIRDMVRYNFFENTSPGPWMVDSDQLRYTGTKKGFQIYINKVLPMIKELGEISVEMYEDHWTILSSNSKIYSGNYGLFNTPHHEYIPNDDLFYGLPISKISEFKLFDDDFDINLYDIKERSLMLSDLVVKKPTVHHITNVRLGINLGESS